MSEDYCDAYDDDDDEPKPVKMIEGPSRTIPVGLTIPEGYGLVAMNGRLVLCKSEHVIETMSMEEFEHLLSTAFVRLMDQAQEPITDIERLMKLFDEIGLEYMMEKKPLIDNPKGEMTLYIDAEKNPFGPCHEMYLYFDKQGKLLK